jgi:hypothetical protein
MCFMEAMVTEDKFDLDKYLLKKVDDEYVSEFHDEVDLCSGRFLAKMPTIELTKADIVMVGQKHVDSDMDADFEAGRMFGVSGNNN